MDNHPQWIVLRYNINARKIEPHNVLTHCGVIKDIVKATKCCKTNEEFAKKLRSSLMYYYWSKSEWEIIVAPWCGDRDAKEIKIDVFDQVMYNWDHFLEYVWNERKRICLWNDELKKKFGNYSD